MGYFITPVRVAINMIINIKQIETEQTSYDNFMGNNKAFNVHRKIKKWGQ